MPENIINCQSLPCPEPIIKTKKFIEANQPQTVSVVVDNEAAKENVTHLLSSLGYSVSIQNDENIYTLLAIKTKEGSLPSSVTCTAYVPTEEKQKILVVISSEFFGSGSDELGIKLMKNYLGSLLELVPDLWRIILLNGGVKLCVKDSPVIEQLQALKNDGVDILACGTCLDFFGLLQNKAVGDTTNMLDVVTSMHVADKVITL